MPDEVPNEPEPSFWDQHLLVIVLLIPLALIGRGLLARLLEW